MSKDSAEWPALVQCCTTRKREKQHVVIYYPRYDTKYRMRGSLVSIPIDTLIHPSSNNSHSKIQQLLPCPEGGELNLNVGRICVGPRFYFLGGFEPHPASSCSWESMKECFIKDVFCYQLDKLPSNETGKFKKCEDMLFGMSNPLLVQVNTSLYALGYGKMKESENLSLVFQKYDLRKNKWTSLKQSLFDINNCDVPVCWIRNTIERIPHVVIGKKLHVSLGNSSFTYDTKNDKWYDCELFESFWSKKIRKKKKTGRPSPLDFYGKEVWNGASEIARKRKKEPSPFGGGPPFGFTGRGILWDEDILLGIHHGDNCPVVAFLLDKVSGKVLKSQPLILDNLLSDILPYGAHFVDLGRDGHFSFVHFVGSEDEEEGDDWELRYHMELLTFKVKKIGEATDDNFLECTVISNEVVVENEHYSTASYCSAFSV